jgi:hypothetical protein
MPAGHVDLTVDMDLAGLQLRTEDDAPCWSRPPAGRRAEHWDARPLGPYSLPDAQAALASWNLERSDRLPRSA